MSLESIKRPLRRVVQALGLKPWVDRLLKPFRPRLAADLAAGTDAGVIKYYNSRVTDCHFLQNAEHYERPRIEWVLSTVRHGRVLEIGCGNGGMTRLLSQQVESLVALDVSRLSLQQLDALGLPNVQTAEGLIEHYEPAGQFDWIVMSEVVEHLREPENILRRCITWLKPGGSLMLTTPNGPWETIEHLHEFSMATFCALVGRLGARAVDVGLLQDREGSDRWLVARVSQTPCPSIAVSREVSDAGVK